MIGVGNLIGRVKAANGPDRELDRAIGLAVGGWWATVDEHGDAIMCDGDRYPDHPGSMYPALTESVDAALALVERLLPGWRVSIFGNHLTGAKGGKGWRVGLQSPQKAKPDSLGFRWPKINADCLYAPTAPLAILAALLSALTTLQDQNNHADRS